MSCDVTMGKKKKVKATKARDKTKIEERIKSVANIKLPDTVEFKKDNEAAIDSFYRFNRFNKVGKEFKNIKEESRYRHRK